MPYRKRRKSSSRKVVTVKQLKSYVHRHIENKFAYGYLPTNFASVSNAWVELDLLNSIGQGVSLNTRIAQRVRIRSIMFRGILAQGSAESALDDPYNAMRICLLKAETPSLTPLTTAGYTINSLILSQSGFTGLKRIYMDKYIALNVSSTEKGAGDGYAPDSRTLSFYKRFKNPWEVTWSTSAAGTNNYRIFLSMISDSAAIPNPGFTHGYWKVEFEDA